MRDLYSLLSLSLSLLLFIYYIIIFILLDTVVTYFSISLFIFNYSIVS